MLYVLIMVTKLDLVSTKLHIFLVLASTNCTVNKIILFSWNGAAQEQLAMKCDILSHLLFYNCQKYITSDIKLTIMKKLKKT